jgi:high affinity Mn2+ porin
MIEFVKRIAPSLVAGLLDRARPIALRAILATIAFPALANAADPPSAPGPDAQATTSPPEAADAPENWAVHGQSTFLLQYHPGFGSSVPQGPQSLDSGRRGDETFDATLFAGLRLWTGAEFWINPEIDQGFGLQNTLGIAGFTSGEAYKIGETDPYYRMTRAFIRQTIGLGGETEKVDPDQNILGGTRDKNRIVITFGKFSVTDIFDTNKYAHDPRADFMNWSLIDSGAFDYAADSWGYTYGAVAEWYQDWWTLRAGLFDLSTTPNSEHLVLRPGQQFEAVTEAEERHTLFGQPGKLKLLLYVNRALMARLSTFTQVVASTGVAPSLASLRHLNNRPGAALNLEQSLTEDLGMFARLSAADGRYETFDFTDIDQSAAAGLSLTGKRWGRDADTVAAAFVVNEASRQRLDFFRAGGLGVLVGDGYGQPASAGPEQIFESYYNIGVTKWLNVTLDYQLVNHPGYNAGRGPVHVFGFRLHAQI